MMGTICPALGSLQSLGVGRAGAACGQVWECSWTELGVPVVVVGVPMEQDGADGPAKCRRGVEGASWSTKPHPSGVLEVLDMILRNIIFNKL